MGWQVLSLGRTNTPTLGNRELQILCYCTSRKGRHFLCQTSHCIANHKGIIWVFVFSGDCRATKISSSTQRLKNKTDTCNNRLSGTHSHCTWWLEFCTNKCIYIYIYIYVCVFLEFTSPRCRYNTRAYGTCIL